MKKMIYGIIAASAVFLTACGAKNTSKPEESKSSSKPADTALTIYDKAKDEQKSVENSSYKLTMDMTNDEEKVNVKFNGQQALNPDEKLRGKYILSSSTEKTQSIGVYFDENVVYLEKQGKWVDAGAEREETTDQFRILSKKPDLSVFSRDAIKKADLKQEDGEDVIDLKAGKSDLKDIHDSVVELASIPGFDIASSGLSDDIKVTKARYKMTYDSKTHFIKKAELNFTLDSGTDDMKYHIVIEYGDHNEAEVKKPTSVLKAK